MIHQEPLQLSELSSQKSMVVVEGVGFDPSRNCSVLPPLHLSQLYWENSPKINLMEFYPKLLPTLQSDLEVGNLSVQQRGKLRGGWKGGM